MKLLRLIVVASLFVGLVAAGVPTALAQSSGERSPGIVWFQGFVTDQGTGNPIEGSHDMTFGLYTVESGGGPVWGESHPGVSFSHGWFSVELGNGDPRVNLPPFDEDYWLEVGIDTEILGGRSRLGSSPYWSGGTVSDRATFESGAVVAGGDFLMYGPSYIRCNRSATDPSRHWILDTDGLWFYNPEENDLVLALEGGTYPSLELEVLDGGPSCFLATASTGGLLQLSDTSGSGVVQLDGLDSVGTLELERRENSSECFLEAAEDGGLLELSSSSGQVRVKLYARNGNCGRLELDGPYPITLDACIPGAVFTGGARRPVARSRTSPDESVVYCSPAGPEMGTYVRGTARLSKGTAFVELPGHFSDATAHEGVTVHVTPLSAESMGIAVTAASSDGFEVRELLGGTGTYEFSYIVHGVQRDSKTYDIVQEFSCHGE
ncbi:hypothetical protein KAW64_16495 [bacterium]|nr:hypothetical protein [bacterium]